MDYKRILTISRTLLPWAWASVPCPVALPILSAQTGETAIAPSAVLSTALRGLSRDFTWDLTEDIPAIQHHWQQEGIRFQAVYTGYLGEAPARLKWSKTSAEIFCARRNRGSAMADRGENCIRSSI